jgi:ATP-binding cassette subfamily B protein
VNSDGANIYIMIGLIGFVLALPILVEPVTFHIKSRIFESSLREITSQVYRNILIQDYSFHINRQTGKLISQIIEGNEIMGMYTWQLEWFVFENFARLVIPIILVALISPTISIAIILIIIVFIPLLIWSLRVNVNARVEVKDAAYNRNTAVIDGIGNFETVRSFGTEKFESEFLDVKLAIHEKALNRYQNTFRLLDFVGRLISVLVFIVAGMMTAYYFESSIITLGMVVVIISYLIQMTGGLMSMIFSLRDVLKNLPIAEEYFELLENKPSIIELESPNEIEEVRGNISFENITFNYDNEKSVLSGLSLEIKEQQNVALVGPSGGGKSTITRLLMRYYDSNEGTVSIDGVDIKDLSFETLRSLIGLVPQEPVLFNRSIFYNVGYSLDGIGDPRNERNRELVIEACKRAHIHEFISGLKDGYETFVGERGLKLSGGQKQRIAIARVLIKDPKIVIFDEATSMLDSESEKEIQKAFKELSKEKTTLVIAHRLSTITHCDNIMVIDEGKLVEQGTHYELLDEHGIYASLWNIQSGGFQKG